MLCRNCKAGKCSNAPTPDEPVYVECTECGELGCEHCGGTGKVEITQCPRGLVEIEDYDVIEAAELYEKGLPPVAGGSRDQARWFAQAARFVSSEKAMITQQMMKDR